MTDSSKKKVLLLDDELLLLDLYKTRFAASGWEVCACETAELALTALRSGFDPDAVLFDITMPAVSGYEFIEVVRREKLAARAVLAALTNEGQDAEIARLKDLGAHAHIMKSDFTPAELVERVSELIADHQKPKSFFARFKK